MHEELICINCPIGCRLDIELDDQGNFISVSGNLCPKGKEYAIKEMTAPVRTLTTTIRIENGQYPLVSVRSDKPLPKDSLFDVMDIIDHTIKKAPIKIGDILISNILGLEVNIIATSNNPLK